jgi:hypothetical protein
MKTEEFREKTLKEIADVNCNFERDKHSIYSISFRPFGNKHWHVEHRFNNEDKPNIIMFLLFSIWSSTIWFL